MAVTITRSTWIDDDGSGTTGTVINQALHTTLYNEIDTALAKVAQLAGGNTFTGNQSMPGILSAGLVLVNAPSPPGVAGQAVVFLQAENVQRIVGVSVQNTSATNTLYFVGYYNSAGGAVGNIQQTGATSCVYNTSSDARLKTDRGVAHDLAALRAVVVHDFVWTADGTPDRGVFAQDAHALYPRAVSTGTDERTPSGTLKQPWMTDYSKFVPDLIVGWQQHDAAIAAIRALLAGVTG